MASSLKNKVRIGVDDFLNKFIYVFGEEAKEMLLAKKYTLLKSDIKNNIYVFENKPEQCFDVKDIVYTLSDILTY